MPYTKIAPNNYSIEYNVDLPEDSENWYEVSEFGNYKLVDGKIEPCEFEEHQNAFVQDRVETSFVVELKTYVSQFLSDTDWLVNRHLEQRDIAPDRRSIEEGEYRFLILYRQYLRDLTNNPPKNPQSFTFKEFHLRDRYSYFSYQNLSSLFPNKEELTAL